VITTVFTGLPVSDIEAARAWYERLLGRPPDLPVNDNESAWQLAGEAWMYIIGDAERAGRGLLAPIVDDLEATVAGLASRGIDVGPIEPVGSAGDRTVVIDPDGNWLGFTQVRAS
jgi:catechol 2,3-dioxygenase-like lactoylglutathione lyase family enzyme